MTPPIQFHISPSEDAPIYRQVVRQVASGIASGALAPGEQLPSIRALAQDLVVAPLTVKKAYDVLEADGVIETRRGKGSFVSEGAAPSSESAAERLRPLARRLVAEAEVAGLGSKALNALIKEESKALQEERRGKGESS